MNHLKCTGCQDQFGLDRKVPKVLPCLHGICDRCEGTSGQTVDCNRCNRKRIHRKGIKDDPVRKNELMVTLARRFPDRLFCTNKNDGKLASIYCLECLHLLCEECQMAHNKVQTTTKHKCLSIHDLGRGAVSEWNTKLRCGKHPDYPLLFFSQDVLVCLYCVRAGQQLHPVEDIENAFGKERGNLQILSERLARRIAQIQRHGPRVTSNQNPKRAIKDAFARLRAAVRSRQIEIMDSLPRKRDRTGQITFKTDIPRNLPDGDLNLLHYHILKNGYLTGSTGKIRFLSPNIQSLMNKLWYFGRLIDPKTGKDINGPFADRNRKLSFGEMPRRNDQLPQVKSGYPGPRNIDGQEQGKKRERNQGSDPSRNPQYVEPVTQGGTKGNDPHLKENHPYLPVGYDGTDGRPRRQSYRDEPSHEAPYYSEPLMADSWGPQSMSPQRRSRESLPTSSPLTDEAIVPQSQRPQYSEAPNSDTVNESRQEVPGNPPYKEESIIPQTLKPQHTEPIIPQRRDPQRSEPIIPETQDPQRSESIIPETQDPQHSEPIVPETQDSQHSEPIIPLTQDPQHSEPIIPQTQDPQHSEPILPDKHESQHSESIIPETQVPQHSEPMVPETKEPQHSEPIIPQTQKPQHTEPIIPETQKPQHTEPIISETKEPQHSEPIIPETLEPQHSEPIIPETQKPQHTEPIIPETQKPQHTEPIISDSHPSESQVDDNRGRDSTIPDEKIHTPTERLPEQSSILNPDEKENTSPHTMPGSLPPNEEGLYDEGGPFSHVPIKDRPLYYQFPWITYPRDTTLPEQHTEFPQILRDPSFSTVSSKPTAHSENREPLKNTPPMTESKKNQPDHTSQAPITNSTLRHSDVPEGEPLAETKPGGDARKDEPLVTSNPERDTPKEEPSDDNNNITTVVLLINMITGTCAEIGRIQVLDGKLVPIEVSPGDIIGHLLCPSGDLQSLEIIPSQYNSALLRIIYSPKEEGIYGLPIDFKGQRLPGNMQLEAGSVTEISRDAVIFVTEMKDMKITCDHIVLCPNMDDAGQRNFSDRDRTNMSAPAQAAMDMGVRNYTGAVSGFPIDFEGLAYMEVWMETVLRKKAEARTVVFEVGLASQAAIDSIHIMEGQDQAWGISISYDPELKGLCKRVWGSGENFDNGPVKGHTISRTMSFKFGILLDSQHNKLVIFDLERDDSFSVVPRVDFGMSLLPVWGACNYGNADVNINCISGDALQLGRLNSGLFLKALQMSKSD
ncbi:uncharacterized protein [Haliotis asinina]|uniref:uncharacterized protein n=1 Tax=Haliotis asinina TaxID=109174 RepID=UPI003531A1CF